MMEALFTTRAAGYLRASTDAQETDRQEREIGAYCQLHGLDLVTIFREREAVSGRSSAVRQSPADALRYYRALADADFAGLERSGYGDLLAYVREGKVDVVVFYALDRLARDAIELLLMERLLAVHDCRLITITGGGTIDTATASGWLQFAIQALLAEFECRQTADRTKATLAARRDSGVHVGHPPIGWRRGADGWERDPATWPDVQTAHDLRAAGATYREIAKELGISISQVRPRLRAYAWRPGKEQMPVTIPPVT